GGAADVVQEALVVVEAYEERADHAAADGVAEAADHAIDAADELDLDHGVALAGAVGAVGPFGDDAVEIAAHRAEPALRLAQAHGRRGEADGAVPRKRLLREGFEQLAAFLERQLDQAAAFVVGEKVEGDEEGRRFGGELADVAFGGVDGEAGGA